MREPTIAAVQVEAVSGPAGRFPYPLQWQAVPLDVYLAPGEPAEAPAEPDPGQIVASLGTACTRPSASWPASHSGAAP